MGMADVDIDKSDPLPSSAYRFILHVLGTPKTVSCTYWTTGHTQDSQMHVIIICTWRRAWRTWTSRSRNPCPAAPTGMHPCDCLNEPTGLGRDLSAWNRITIVFISLEPVHCWDTTLDTYHVQVTCAHQILATHAHPSLVACAHQHLILLRSSVLHSKPLHH